MKQPGKASSTLFPALLIGFGAQIAGRLVDLRWHLTHEEFEGAVEQLQAHWLIWITTVFVIGIVAVGVSAVDDPGQRRGYLLVLVANLAYGVVAVIHFLQHVNRLEADWAHLLLAITSIAAAVGVVWVVTARFASRHSRKEAVA